MDRAEAVIPAQGTSGVRDTGAEGSAAARQIGAAARRGESPHGAESRLRVPRAWLDPYLLAVAFFALYTALSVTRYRQLLTMSWDLGIFEQAVKSYAHLHAPVADLKGPGTNILGDHFSPITATLAPFYRVFPTPVTLLVAQALLFAVSVIPVTRVTAHLLGRGRGLAVGTAYGLSWGVQKAVQFDFHEIAFAMPLLAFSLEAVLRRKWAAALWWAVPLVLVKEDMGVTAAAIGVIVWWRTRKDDVEDTEETPDAAGEDGKAAESTEAGSAADDEPLSDALRYGPWAIGLVGFGVAASALAFGLIIPAFNSAGGYDYWNKLSGNGAPMPGHIPLHVATHTLLWLLLPTSGLLALRSPLLLAALPTIGWRFISHDDHYWGTDWHYSAVLMPVVFLAMVDAVVRVRESRRPWLRSYASGAPAAIAGATLALSMSMPLWALTHTDSYRVDARTRAVDRLLDRIPDGATVEANVGPISRLVHRTTVYWVGDTPGVVPEYLALDDSSGWVPDPVTYARQLHPASTYTEVGSSGGYVVLRRT